MNTQVPKIADKALPTIILDRSEQEAAHSIKKEKTRKQLIEAAAKSGL
jgi:hypothetical protein